MSATMTNSAGDDAIPLQSDDRLAWQQRPRQVREVKVRVSSTRKVVLKEEVYRDTNKFDAMHEVCQLSDRQHAAGMKLYGLFVASGLGARITFQYGERIKGERLEADPGDAVDEDGKPLETPRKRYRKLLKGLPDHTAGLLDAACHGQHPGRWLRTLQGGLETLADEWGLE